MCIWQEILGGIIYNGSINIHNIIVHASYLNKQKMFIKWIIAKRAKMFPEHAWRRKFSYNILTWCGADFIHLHLMLNEALVDVVTSPEVNLVATHWKLPVSRRRSTAVNLRFPFSMKRRSVFCTGWPSCSHEYCTSAGSLTSQRSMALRPCSASWDWGSLEKCRGEDCTHSTVKASKKRAKERESRQVNYGYLSPCSSAVMKAIVHNRLNNQTLMYQRYTVLNTESFQHDARSKRRQH